MKRFAIYSGVLILFTLLTLWLTWPLATHFTTAIPGKPLDSFEYLWKVRWFQEALFNPHLSVFFTDKVFYPFGHHLALGETTLSQILLGLPWATIAGDVIAYNVISVVSFVLAAFGAYLLVLYYTGGHLAAIAGGVIFAFCPVRMVSLANGMMPQLGTMWLPYIILTLEKLRRGGGLRCGIAGGIFCALTIFSAWYNVPLLAVVLGIYPHYCAGSFREYLHSPGFRSALVAFGSILLLSIGLSLFLTYPLWHSETQSAPYSLRYLDYWSPSLDHFVIPYFLRTLLGKPPVSTYIHIVSLPVYVGLLTLMFAIVGTIRGGKDKHFFVWLGLCSLLLALGPRLRWDGEPVLIRVPAQIERVFKAGMHILATRLALTPLPTYYALHEPGTIYIPLPTLLVQLFVPLMSRIRHWYRFAFTLDLALSILAGMGIAHFDTLRGTVFSGLSKKHWRMACAVLESLIILALFLEFAILPYQMGYCEVRPQPVDLWLAEQEGDFAIAEFPYYSEIIPPGLMQYRTVFHGKKICTGNATFAPQGYRAAMPLIYAFPDAESIAMLKRWGPKYILIGSYSYGEEWQDVRRRLDEQPDLRLVAVFESLPVYHALDLWRVVPGYDLVLPVDQIHVYELIVEGDVRK